MSSKLPARIDQLTHSGESLRLDDMKSSESVVPTAAHATPRESRVEPQPSRRVKRFRRALLPLSLMFLACVAVWLGYGIATDHLSGSTLVGGIINVLVGLSLAYQGWEYRRDPLYR